MSDFLRRLAPPRGGDATRAAPLLPSRYEPAAGLSAWRPFGRFGGAAELGVDADADAAGPGAAPRADGRSTPFGAGVPAQPAAAHGPSPTAATARPLDVDRARHGSAAMSGDAADGTGTAAADPLAPPFARPPASTSRTTGAVAQAVADAARHAAARDALAVEAAARSAPRAVRDAVRIAPLPPSAPLDHRLPLVPPLRRATVAAHVAVGAERASAPAAPRVVHVTIDRIEVRLPRPPAAAPASAPREPAAPATVALADYLRGQRHGVAG